jgi:transposase
MQQLPVDHRKSSIALRLSTRQDVMDDAISDTTPAIRFRAIDRDQAIAVHIDELLPADHPARLLVAFVAGLDFSALYATIKARTDRPGAPAFRPEMLFSLWLFATVEGVASARRLEVLCVRDCAYRWICGGPSPNYHTLSTFYATNGEFLDETFVDILATLTARQLLTVKAIAVDGRKIPANASKESFHRAATLDQHRLEAEQRVAALRDQRTEALANSSRQAAALRRAAEDRQRRLTEAMATVRRRQGERAATGRASAKPEEARASETDGDARKMKRSHGGFEPAFNVQTATDIDSGLIVAVQVTEQASDNGLLLPMVEQATANLGTPVEQVLADAGYADANDVETLETAQIETLMPPKNERKEKAQGHDPYSRKRRDSDEIAAWRQRMGTPAARERYGRRAPVAEGVHAQQSNRGWKRFRLRGLVKARAEALWQAVAHNLCVLLSKIGLGVGTLRPKSI